MWKNTNPTKLKKLYLAIFLNIFALLEGIFLASFELFPITRATLQQNIITLVYSLILWTFFIFFILILDLGLRKKRNLLFFSLAFNLVLPLTIIRKNLILAPFIFVGFFLFLHFFNYRLRERVKLFVSFRLREIILPILRYSFTLLLLIISLLFYYQTLIRTKNEKIITSDNLRLILSPFYTQINAYANTMLEKTIEEKIQSQVSLKEKKEISALILKESIEALEEGTLRQKIGLSKLKIPAEKIEIAPDGSLNVIPALEAVLPEIAEKLNSLSLQYKTFIPLIVALISFFLISSFINLLFILLYPFLLLTFSTLKKLQIIRIKKIAVEKEVIEI